MIRVRFHHSPQMLIIGSYRFHKIAKTHVFAVVEITVRVYVPLKVEFINDRLGRYKFLHDSGAL